MSQEEMIEVMKCRINNIVAGSLSVPGQFDKGYVIESINMSPIYKRMDKESQRVCLYYLNDRLNAQHTANQLT